MSGFFTRLLSTRGQVVPFVSFEGWWAQTAPLRAHAPATIDRAISLGFSADRLGMAFAGGYTSATASLDQASPEEPVAFCATEDGGGHPSAIHATVLEGGFVRGIKRFVSFGTFAKTLLVVASEGQGADGRNRLRVVRVPARAHGVTLDAGAELPFVPEVPHASVVLDDAPGVVLPGDGYTEYLKPFRTIEDLHVNAAVMAYVLHVALRAEWPREHAEGLLMLLGAARALALQDPRDPVTHLALAGLLAEGRRALERAEGCWAQVGAAERERFTRDRALLGVAAKAREARRVRAWESVLGTDAVSASLRDASQRS